MCNRDQLLEAVYRTEVEKLAAAERKFAETMPPGRGAARLDAAVRGLHRDQADHRPGIEFRGWRPFEGVRSILRRIWDAIRALVLRAVKSGYLRKDLDPIDLLRALMESLTYQPVLALTGRCSFWPESPPLARRHRFGRIVANSEKGSFQIPCGVLTPLRDEKRPIRRCAPRLFGADYRQAAPWHRTRIASEPG